MTVFKLIRRTAFAAIACSALCGCITPNSLLARDASPSTTNGYLGGLFSGEGVPMGRGVSSGFVFVHQESQKEYILPFFAGSMREPYHNEAMRVIEVPPGSYKLKSWIRYDDWYGDVASTVAISPEKPNTTFIVKKAMLTFVGRYETSEREEGTKYFYRNTPKTVTIEEVRRQLRMQFPGLADNLNDN